MKDPGRLFLRARRPRLSEGELINIAGLLTVAAAIFGFCLFMLTLHGCAGAPPKPCPLALEADYTKALVVECADAGTLAACEGFKRIKAEHQSEQEDAGCRVGQ